MNETIEHPEDKAIRLLNQQLDELTEIRKLNYRDAKYKVWKDSTSRFLEKFLGRESPHFIRFRDLRFSGSARMIVATRRMPPPPPNYVSPADMMAFQKACDDAEETLKASIRDIKEFGILGEPKAATSKGNRGSGGGVTQHFNGPVSIHSQAIATDGAIQKIGTMGNHMETSLQQIAEMLPQSEELTPRQVREALEKIQILAEEAAKSEPQRNWKLILQSGEFVFSLVEKATDLSLKLAPYLPALYQFIEKARH